MGWQNKLDMDGGGELCTGLYGSVLDGMGRDEELWYGEGKICLYAKNNCEKQLKVKQL